MKFLGRLKILQINDREKRILATVLTCAVAGILFNVFTALNSNLVIFFVLLVKNTLPKVKNTLP